MRPAIYQVKDLFKEILINENGIDEMCLPDLLDIRGLCWHIIDLIDEREMKLRSAEPGEISKWSRGEER